METKIYDGLVMWTHVCPKHVSKTFPKQQAWFIRRTANEELIATGRPTCRSL